MKWKSFCITSWILVVGLSCKQSLDKDLFIPEIFINSINEPYIVIKNTGHTAITESGIELAVNWNNEKTVYLLDTLDPHFRKPNDSSIIKLPFKLNSHSVFVSAEIDLKNVVTESNEDHNYYSKSLMPDSIGYTIPYPLIKNTFNKAAYIQLFESLPFANQVIWYEKDKPYILSFWKKAWQDVLIEKIEKYYLEGECNVRSDSFNVNGFSRDTAFDIYCSYIAHALVVETQDLVPWSVKDYNPSALAPLWNSKNYFKYDSLADRYSLDFEASGGVILTNPLISYLFAKSFLEQDINTTLIRLIEWMKHYITHREGKNLIQYQMPHRITFPNKGQSSIVHSCWEASGLILDVCRSINIPIIKSKIELHNGTHATVFFPTLNKYISHVDDLYDPLFQTSYSKGTIHTILLSPTEHDQITRSEIYCIGKNCHSRGTQNTYNRRKLLLTRAIESESPILKLEWHDSKSRIQAILRGDDYPSYLIPLFDTETQNIIISTIKNWPLQISTIKALQARYTDAKNNTR